MNKKEIRQHLIKSLKTQGQKEKAGLDKLLLEEVIKSRAYQDSQVIATYMALAFEYNTQLLIERAVKDGKKILIPRTQPQGEMVFAPYHPDYLVKSQFGILEPDGRQKAVASSEIDLIHVPGLAFNPKGFRIGFGKGYYDRYLGNFKGRTFSTIYARQRIEFQEDAHDIAVMEVFSQ
ncbi:5-formyltetrahydrofolate cyclo-ligase [Streptococcus pantholopis]|uniref:5-formyltetrahydrofolate cyclo-ligase n=1 Tax=Streptococcus pantholopis TaxID=1811193 RepID=A0A172Q9H9_9STRE|nr:5-formyltetrahydrofolate cyclo-ligase [Streptococcus pantholopis]AND80088.1 5-formyltetrahydrofolate cyclo-ligase [Streptococcus pantholopis]